MARSRAARGKPPPPERPRKSEGARPFCYRCRRAQVMCLCSDLPALDTRTRVVFLQHEDEAWNRIGTARLAHLSLRNSLLIEGRFFDENPAFLEALGTPGRERAILFPSRDSVPLEARGPDAPPLDLVVIDGTWSQAKMVVNKTAALRSLPRVRLPSGERSRYRIRLQPKPECVSTVEAAVRALGVLEGDPAPFAPLLAAFDRMIDRQIQAALSAGRAPVRDLRQERARRPLPPLLAGDLSKIVLVFGETLGRRRPEDGGRLVILVQWLAFRLSTGELFRTMIDPGRPLEPHEAQYLGLTAADVAAGVDAQGLRDKWAAWVRPGDVFVSWGYFATNLLEPILGAPLDPQVDLRQAAKTILQRRVQHPEHALAELELTPPAPLGPGRGGQRLAALERILNGLRNPLGDAQDFSQPPSNPRVPQQQ